MANTETKVDLVINRMSQSKYEQLKSAGQLNPNQIYMTTDGTDPVPETRKVNGKTLEADVTLTGADIAVSTSDSTKINTALAGKAATNHTHPNYVPTSRTIAGQDLTANITAATLATAIGLDNCVKNNSSNSIEANESSLGFGIYNNSATSGADAWLYLSSGTGEFGISTSSTDTYMLVDQYQYRFPSGGGTLLTSIPTSYKTYADTLTQLGTDGFKTYADTKTALDSVYKPLQTAKTDPTASGTTTDFIDTISQNANGVITATKKTISAASTSAAGIVQLSDSIITQDSTKAATSYAVKKVNDVLADCLKTNVDNQTMDGVRTLSFTSTKAFPDDSYTVDTLINRIVFYDSTGYNLCNLNTRQTSAGNAMTQLSMVAPFGDDDADIQTYLRLYVNKAGKYAYATVPTPPSNSNTDAVATTEWIYNHLPNRLMRTNVSTSTYTLVNQKINYLSLSSAGTYTLVVPARPTLSTLVSRKFSLYVYYTGNSTMTLKFSTTDASETPNTISYYCDYGFTPTKTIPAKGGMYYYEFVEFSANAFYVKQTRMENHTSDLT